jgi:hypothetical protein
LKGKFFEVGMLGVILLNVIVLASPYYDMPEWHSDLVVRAAL